MARKKLQHSNQELVELFNAELRAPFHSIDRLPYIAHLWTEFGRRGISTEGVLEELPRFGVDKRVELDRKGKKLSLRYAAADMTNIVPFDLLVAKDIALGIFLLTLQTSGRNGTLLR